MELRCICWRCLGSLEANGATLHLLGVPWTFGSKWSYAPFVGGALDLWKQMELRSICWGCLGPLEANGAMLHLLGMPSSTDHLTIVFNTMSIHKSSSYQTYTAIQSIVHQSSMSLLTTSVYTTLVVFLSSCPCWKITNTLDG